MMIFMIILDAIFRIGRCHSRNRIIGRPVSILRLSLLTGCLAALTACVPDGPPQSANPAIGNSGTTPQIAASCQPGEQFFFPQGRGLTWRGRPSVVILARGDDSRIQSTRDAIGHWNWQFEDMGAGFRFGSVTVEARSSDMEFYMSTASESVMSRDRGMPPGAPADLSRFCGNIVVVLSDENFISFAKIVRNRGLVLIGIKGPTHFPLHLPNVTRNIIAHEIGHAIGLRHNADETTLMCGRPAQCSPTRFQANTARFFPLTRRETRILAYRYPSDWPNN